MGNSLPDLKGFETYYGLRVADIGEDGNVIVLGHYHDSPLRVIAALNKHARTFWGLTNLLDDPGAELADLKSALTETYAVVEKYDGNLDWYISWNEPANRPGAFPATIWGA